MKSSPRHASAVFSGALWYSNFGIPGIPDAYTDPTSPGGNASPSSSRIVISSPGKARPTLPGLRSHSSGEMTVHIPSLAP